MENKKAPGEREQDIIYECDCIEVREGMEHFKNYGVEEGKVIGFSLINNNEHIQKTLFDNFMITTTKQEERKKFRIIISYDPDYPYVLVKQIVIKA